MPITLDELFAHEDFLAASDEEKAGAVRDWLTDTATTIHETRLAEGGEGLTQPEAEYLERAASFKFDELYGADDARRQPSFEPTREGVRVFGDIYTSQLEGTAAKIAGNVIGVARKPGEAIRRLSGELGPEDDTIGISRELENAVVRGTAGGVSSALSAAAAVTAREGSGATEGQIDAAIERDILGRSAAEAAATVARRDPEEEEAFRNFQEAEGFVGKSIEVIKNPIDMLLPTVFESMSAQSPALAATIVAGAKAGPVGAGVAATAGGFLTEFSFAIQEGFENEGVDISDPNAIRDAYRDPEILGNVLKKSAKRGSTMAAFNALTLGLGARFLGATKMKRIARVALLEPGAEGAGEALGGLVSGIGGSVEDVILETFAGFGTQAPEVLGTTISPNEVKPPPIIELDSPDDVEVFAAGSISAAQQAQRERGGDGVPRPVPANPTEDELEVFRRNYKEEKQKFEDARNKLAKQESERMGLKPRGYRGASQRVRDSVDRKYEELGISEPINPDEVFLDEDALRRADEFQNVANLIFRPPLAAQGEALDAAVDAGEASQLVPGVDLDERPDVDVSQLTDDEVQRVWDFITGPNENLDASLVPETYVQQALDSVEPLSASRDIPETHIEPVLVAAAERLVEDLEQGDAQKVGKLLAAILRGTAATSDVPFDDFIKGLRYELRNKVPKDILEDLENSLFNIVEGDDAFADAVERGDEKAWKQLFVEAAVAHGVPLEQAKRIPPIKRRSDGSLVSLSERFPPKKESAPLVEGERREGGRVKDTPFRFSIPFGLKAGDHIFGGTKFALKLDERGRVDSATFRKNLQANPDIKALERGYIQALLEKEDIVDRVASEVDVEKLSAILERESENKRVVEVLNFEVRPEDETQLRDDEQDTAATFEVAGGVTLSEFRHRVETMLGPDSTALWKFQETPYEYARTDENGNLVYSEDGKLIATDESPAGGSVRYNFFVGEEEARSMGLISDDELSLGDPNVSYGPNGVTFRASVLVTEEGVYVSVPRMDNNDLRKLRNEAVKVGGSNNLNDAFVEDDLTPRTNSEIENGFRNPTGSVLVKANVAQEDALFEKLGASLWSTSFEMAKSAENYNRNFPGDPEETNFQIGIFLVGVLSEFTDNFFGLRTVGDPDTVRGSGVPLSRTSLHATTNPKGDASKLRNPRETVLVDTSRQGSPVQIGAGHRPGGRDRDVLGWSAEYVESGVTPNGVPITGLFAYEIQSDWGQQVAKIKRAIDRLKKDLKRQKEEVGEEAEPSKRQLEETERELQAINSFWLDKWERMVIHSMIAAAKEKGLSHIIITDEVTSSLTQHHEIFTPDGGDPTTTQHSGMIAAYKPGSGRTHKIASELTGSNGIPLYMGEHGNSALLEGEADSFFESKLSGPEWARSEHAKPKGSPHTEITGIAYPIDQAEDVISLPSKRGKNITAFIHFFKNGKTLIAGLKGKTRVSDFIHEHAHYVRRNMQGEHLVTLEEAYGVEGGVWTRKQEERFAKDVERYLFQNKLPERPKKNALRMAFDRVVDLMREVYKNAKQIMGKEINPSVVEVLDNIFEVGESVLNKEKAAVSKMQREGRKNPRLSPGEARLKIRMAQRTARAAALRQKLEAAREAAIRSGRNAGRAIPEALTPESIQKQEEFLNSGVEPSEAVPEDPGFPDGPEKESAKESQQEAESKKRPPDPDAPPPQQQGDGRPASSSGPNTPRTSGTPESRTVGNDPVEGDDAHKAENIKKDGLDTLASSEYDTEANYIRSKFYQQVIDRDTGADAAEVNRAWRESIERRGLGIYRKLSNVDTEEEALPVIKQMLKDPRGFEKLASWIMNTDIDDKNGAMVGYMGQAFLTQAAAEAAKLRSKDRVAELNRMRELMAEYLHSKLLGAGRFTQIWRLYQEMTPAAIVRGIQRDFARTASYISSATTRKRKMAQEAMSDADKQAARDFAAEIAQEVEQVGDFVRGRTIKTVSGRQAGSNEVGGARFQASLRRALDNLKKKLDGFESFESEPTDKC